MTPIPEIPNIPDSAPFTAEQRAWLNEYLARLFSPGNSLSPPPSAETPIVPPTPRTGTAAGQPVSPSTRRRQCNPRRRADRAGIRRQAGIS